MSSCNHAGPHKNKGWRHCKTTFSVQRYLCIKCHRCFSERTKTIMHGLRSTNAQVISSLHARSEGVGLRAAGRLVKKRHPTIASWEVKAKKLGEILDRKALVDYNVLLESDEL